MSITLYTRTGCHLCSQAHTLLTRAARDTPVTLAVVDIDADPALRELYGERIPVARFGTTELDWPFTHDQARRALAAELG